MNEKEQFTSEDVFRLLELVTSAAEARNASVSDVIDSFQRFTLPHPSRSQGLGAFTAEFVERMRLIRLRRNSVVGSAMFRDPAWDMLLELFSAHHQSRQLSTSSLCYASGVPLSTALRQLDKLERHGLVIRREDQSDNRQWLVEATAKGLEAVAAVVAELIDNFYAVESAYLVRREDLS